MNDIYSTTLWAILVATAVLVYRDQKRRGSEEQVLKSAEFIAFQRNYLLVYLLAFLGDWLQGPYVYALYADYGFDQGDIAMLFICGFLSSLVFGTLAGGMADKFGRRALCFVFAVSYTLSCITKLWNNYQILMVGRVLGGLSTSLIFTVFEAWMVSEHNARGFDPKLLSDTFGKATLGNGVIAIVAGQIAQFAADKYGYVGPFVVAILPLSIVGLLVMLTWSENYGDSRIELKATFQNAWKAAVSDKAVLSLGLGQSAFEGAMYTFVFMWTPALATEETKDTLPYGTIFAAFMACCMLGSSIFTELLNLGWKVERIPVLIHFMAIASMGAVAFMSTNSSVVYLAFLAFEISCGIFFPTYGTLRSEYIPEANRAGIMNLFRIPLNAFVVIVLVKVKFMSIFAVFSICTAAHAMGYFSFTQFTAAVTEKRNTNVLG